MLADIISYTPNRMDPITDHHNVTDLTLDISHYANVLSFVFFNPFFLNRSNTSSIIIFNPKLQIKHVCYIWNMQ